MVQFYGVCADRHTTLADGVIHPTVWGLETVVRYFMAPWRNGERKRAHQTFNLRVMGSSPIGVTKVH